MKLDFITYDKKFIIKPIKKHEKRLFLDYKLERYFERVINESHLQHIYGIFKLTIKGKIYRLMIAENNYYGNVHSHSMSIHLGVIDHDQICEGMLYDVFILDTEEKRRFGAALSQDIEYLYGNNGIKCKVLIDIVDECDESRNHLYKGIYKGKDCYISMIISDVSYSKKILKGDKTMKSMIEMNLAENTLEGIEEKIRKYIKY
jgi:hypothetical protein